jgi:segregation and condensation protein B
MVEALLFASDAPLGAADIARIDEAFDEEQVESMIAELKQQYEEEDRAFGIFEVAGGYQVLTRPEYAFVLERFETVPSTTRLSPAALETLAVVAYRQPITAPEIAEVRGVNTSGVLGTLVERRLVKVTGRKAVVGRPFLYATTREFLDRFGLKDLSDLPKVEDMAEALGMEVPSGLAEPHPLDEALPFEQPMDPTTPPNEQVH